MTDDASRYGFRWGPMVVQRNCHVKGRGYSLTLKTDYVVLDISVSEAGKVVRIVDDSGLPKGSTAVPFLIPPPRKSAGEATPAEAGAANPPADGVESSGAVVGSSEGSPVTRREPDDPQDAESAPPIPGQESMAVTL